MTQKKECLALVIEIAGGVLSFLLCGVIVMHLWNWTMPEIFGLKKLNFWQVVGLLLLTRFIAHGRLLRVEK